MITAILTLVLASLTFSLVCSVSLVIMALITSYTEIDLSGRPMGFTIIASLIAILVSIVSLAILATSYLVSP